MNILIVRNDKLGDFVLTLPCYVALKHALPGATITVLVPGYTAAIARCCPGRRVVHDPHPCDTVFYTVYRSAAGS